jgi:hypothetical protein
MTPEPTGGLYKDKGPEFFIRTYGYPDTSGIVDRINFSSPHRFGKSNSRTSMRLEVEGYDKLTGNITDPSGGFSLIDTNGIKAATWHFKGLIEHWNNKHAQAVYVAYKKMTTPSLQYSYGPTARLCEGTDFGKFLAALSSGKIAYDPGLKLENASSSSAKAKCRSQFRIRSSVIPTLYDNVEQITL